jgi:hypothetical protein
MDRSSVRAARKRPVSSQTIKHASPAGDHLHLPEEPDTWDLQRRIRERIKALLATALRNPA